MAKTANAFIRVDPEIKEQAENIMNRSECFLDKLQNQSAIQKNIPTIMILCSCRRILASPCGGRRKQTLFFGFYFLFGHKSAVVFKQ